jgi:hypothetical protein
MSACILMSATHGGVTCGRVAHPFRFFLVEWVTRPYLFHRIFCAPLSDTTPVRPLGVMILNLGCPVLDNFQGRGFRFGFLDQMVIPRSLQGGKSQKPHLSLSVTDGAPELQNQRPGHPPVVHRNGVHAICPHRRESPMIDVVRVGFQYLSLAIRNAQDHG